MPDRKPATLNDLGKLAIEGGQPALPVMPSPFLGASLIGAEERQAVLEVIESGSLFRYYGPNLLGRVAAYEEKFVRRLGIPHVLAVASGTAALRAAYAAVGLRSADEVLMPAYSFLACATSALTCGLNPIFVECDESLLIDPTQVEGSITPHTQALLVVHMNGASCDMDPLLDVAERHNLTIIEDCSQALGARYRGRQVGTFGKVGTFSLQYMKTLTCGEGGVLITSDPDIYQRAVHYHDLGFYRKGREGKPLVGENLRLGELAGAVALVQMARLDEVLDRMRTAHRRLRPLLEQLPGLTPRPVPDADGDSCCSLIFSLKSAEKARFFRKALRAENIPCDSCWDKIGYLYPVMRADRFEVPFWDDERSGPRPSYRQGLAPRTEDLALRSNAIPISPSLTEEELTGTERALRKVARHIQIASDV